VRDLEARHVAEADQGGIGLTDRGDPGRNDVDMPIGIVGLCTKRTSSPASAARTALGLVGR